nr:SSB1A [Arabidopsis thaliana]
MDYSSASLLRICAAAITILGAVSFLIEKFIRSNPQKKKKITASCRNWEHNVFSSFSSVDVPKSFLIRIRKELRRKGFEPLIDNETERCVSIGPELRNAITVSRIVIVVLSRNYALSPWCLDELVEIMKCKEELDQRVVPIFYNLDPIDVLKQTGDFGDNFRKTRKGKTTVFKPDPDSEPDYRLDSWRLIRSTRSIKINDDTAMNKHREECERKNKEDIDRWIKALEQVATIYGYRSRDWDDEKAMVEKIANDISRIMNNCTQSSAFQGLVGMEAHMEKMKELLGLDSDKVRLIGICGLSGSGKTTIAKRLYQQLLPQFELSRIIINIKGCYPRTCYNEDDRKLLLQTHLLSQLLNHKCTGEILQLEAAHEMLKDKKVLLVLDDVDSIGQLDALANEARWFGPGSRIIITTQDQRLLEEQGIQYIYNVDFPPPNGLLPTVYIYCEDTLQYSFASHLSMDFRRKGISAFVNYSETLDVIERVSASVLVFSKSCVSSTSCLDMLVRVFQCRRKTGQLVVPVYYGISSSDVVVQEHKSVDRIREWSSALQELRELPGHHNREECSESELVEEIVKDVHEKLFPTEQIGINLRLLEMEHLLCKQPWGVRRIGIWGMPGIGKTTLAKAFFDQISGGYEASCFIKHFDKAFSGKGLHRLLEEHFGKILKELPRVCSSITRPSLPRDKLSKKRTLVVLDDVHNPLVAESFLEGFQWFGPGSLIIITSRDKQVFRLCQINHVYEVQSFNENEALQLFSQCAFGIDIREQNLLELSLEVIDYASGNPLALSFYGGELKGKELSEMETTFFKLKQRTPYKIFDLFKSSYETLDDNEKNIFLDIACFFSGENVDYVMRLLEGCGFFPHVGIDVLVENCLVTISENRVKMHRIIQDFGREIIDGETVQIERRRRLSDPWSIKFLLEDDELEANEDPKATYTRTLGTEDIEGILLDTSNLTFNVNPGAFENMLSLRFLKIYCSSYENHYSLRLPKGLEFLPDELRLLHWENYPLQSLPQDFDPCHLVELNLSHSQLQKLWAGTKSLEMLKMVKLCHSQQLTAIDDILKAQNIELIDLQGCTKLQSFPATGQLQHLRVVNLSGCREIKSFPEVSPNIEELHLQGTGIRELPISIVSLFEQAKLNRELFNLLPEFSGVSNAWNNEQSTSLAKLVTSTQNLGKLVCLNMKDCVHLRKLPSMFDFESLKVLNLSGCSELDDIEGFPPNVKELYLVSTALKELPQLPQSLEVLNAHGCVSLLSIPSNFKRLPRFYTFSNCFALSASVVNEFVNNALTNVAHIAREKQELNKSLAFSFTVPSPESKNITFDLQPGSSVIIQLGSSWRLIHGFAILVEVAFLEECQAGAFGVSCVCRWKDTECVSHRLEKNFHCWIPGEGVPKDHMFVFCDLDMHLTACEGNDSSILADLVVFEFFTVNKQKKLLDGSCAVTRCGVHVFTAANEDTSSSMTKPFSSSDYLQEIFDNEVEELRVIYDGLDENDRNLLLYMAYLNGEEADFLAPLIASNGLGISSRLNVLANKSLINLSPYGIIVRQGLLKKIGREIVYRQSTLPGSSTVLDRDFVEAALLRLLRLKSLKLQRLKSRELQSWKKRG